jgi:hypothetical protein
MTNTPQFKSYSRNKMKEKKYSTVKTTPVNKEQQLHYFRHKAG